MMEKEKKPSGCWRLSGCLLTTVSGLLIAFFVYMIFYSEQKMDENRAEYAAAQTEYEEAMQAYNALPDSIRSVTAEPEYVRRGAIGFNIGGAFFFIFALIMLLPFGIGVALLLYYRYRNRRWLAEESTLH